GEHQGSPFVVLEFLEGGSLRDRCRAEGPPGPATMAGLRGWLMEVAEALDFIHGRGLIHRDLKPDNVLFDGHGHAYLGDFGIAKAVAAGQKSSQTVLTGAGLVLGTPEYMSPEAVLGETCAGQSDQFGLAVTVFEVLSGRVPAEGATVAAVLVRQAT